MKRFAYLIAFGMALATAYAASQENPNPTQQGTPATTVQQQPHPAQPPTKDTVAPAAPTNQAPASTGTSAASGSAQNENATAQQAQSGTTKAPATTKAPPASAGFFSNPQDTARVQQQLQTAIRNEPTLSSDNLTVSVTDSEIDIGGNVATSKDRLTARRIAQSFAGNRRVREHISVAGASTSPGSPPPSNNADTKNSDVKQPQGELSVPPNQANKPVTDPKQKGDASDRPRI
jgi:hypothetical protein